MQQARLNGFPISHAAMGDVTWAGDDCILLPVADPGRAADMASVAARLATQYQTQVVVLHLLRLSTQAAAALEPPVNLQAFPALEKALDVLKAGGVHAVWLLGIAEDEGEAIRWVGAQLDAHLVLLGWQGKAESDGGSLNAALAGVFSDPTADIAMMGGPPLKSFQRILAPVGGGPHSALALELAMQLAAPVDGGEPGRVTALHVASDGAVSAADMRRIQGYTAEYAGNPQLVTRVVTGGNVAEAILGELASGYDLVVMGTSREALIDRVQLGDAPQRVSEGSQRTPVMVVRRRSEPVTRVARSAWHGLRDAVAQLTDQERLEVHAAIQRGARPRSISL